MSTADSPAPGAPLPDATASLPDDPVILQQRIRELLAVLRPTRHENEQLQHRLDLLLRRLYGPRTERFDPNQPLLIPDEAEGNLGGLIVDEGHLELVHQLGTRGAMGVPLVARGRLLGAAGFASTRRYGPTVLGGGRAYRTVGLVAVMLTAEVTCFGLGHAGDKGKGCCR